MISLDSRTKKPKLWSLLALSLAMIPVLLILYRTGTAGGTQEIQLCTVRSASVLLCLYCMAALFLLGNAFRKQLEYNPYSYNVIYYSGFFFFTFFILEILLFLMLSSFTEADRLGTWDALMTTLLYSARTFVILSMPILMTFCAGLFISNIGLIRRERKSFSNILGMILSVMIFLGEVFLILCETGVFGPPRTHMLHDLGINLFAAIFLYFECMLMGTIVADGIAALIEPPFDRDYLIVLGCGIRADGTPTPLLRGRLNRAIEFYYRQLNETGKELIFVVSGGKGPDESIPESECMRNYLMEHGIRPGQILTEDRSTDTAENMRFSREVILKDLAAKNKVNPDGTPLSPPPQPDPGAADAGRPEGLPPAADAGSPADLRPAVEPSRPGKLPTINRIAFSTTNYHVFRSGLHARRVKMRALGMGSPTRWYFWPNAAVREFVGLLTAHRLKQALILTGIVLIYAGMTLVVYL